MLYIQLVIMFSALLALCYGLYTARIILKSDTGNSRMKEIALAIQEGATAYLNRQYKTITLVGLIITIGLFLLLGIYSAIGFITGAILSGLAGYIGMNVSVRANIRTAEAAKHGLSPA